jgi:hypothetical protein
MRLAPPRCDKTRIISTLHRPPKPSATFEDANLTITLYKAQSDLAAASRGSLLGRPSTILIADDPELHDFAREEESDDFFSKWLFLMNLRSSHSAVSGVLNHAARPAF